MPQGWSTTMANKTINDLTVTTSAASSDLIPLWVAGSSVTRKITKANFMGGVLSGAGTIATAGFTLTLPATGTAALREAANTFTAVQTISYASATLTVTPTSGAGRVQILAADNGTGIGNNVFIQRNSNGSTPAAGLLYMHDLNGTARRVWIDAAGNMRTGTTDPTNANDLSGTVVGTQTSNRAFKIITGHGPTPATALMHIAQAADEVFRFVYKDGSYNNQEFSGLVLDGDTLQRYGMDADKEHPAGKSLNVANLLGDLLVAVADLAARIEKLER